MEFFGFKYYIRVSLGIKVPDGDMIQIRTKQDGEYSSVKHISGEDRWKNEMIVVYKKKGIRDITVEIFKGCEGSFYVDAPHISVRRW